MTTPKDFLIKSAMKLNETTLEEAVKEFEEWYSSDKEAADILIQAFEEYAQYKVNEHIKYVTEL